MKVKALQMRSKSLRDIKSLSVHVVSLSWSLSCSQRWQDITRDSKIPRSVSNCSTFIYDYHSLDVQTKLNWLSATRWPSARQPSITVCIEISANTRYVECHGRALNNYKQFTTGTITADIREPRLPCCTCSTIIYDGWFNRHDDTRGH